MSGDAKALDCRAEARHTRHVLAKRLFMTDQDHLDRINALTQNARSTWFTLLAALVFVGITLMGVEPIDFYGVDRATTLPIVSVEIPTRYFFAAAPVLTAAVYSYFHLTLIRLWDALGNAPARLGEQPLGDAISPWLVSDAALDLRARTRKDASTRRRALEGPTALLNILIAWGFGLLVLALLWNVSLTARSFVLSFCAGISLLVTLVVGLASFATMRKRMRNPDQTAFASTGALYTGYGLLFIGVISVFAATNLRTQGSVTTLVPLDLTGESLVQRPPGWLHYSDARQDFRADWCGRAFKNAPCAPSVDQEMAFQAEFESRRDAARSDLRRADWDTSGSSNMDFRKAKLFNSFLVGANLSGAQLDAADLSFAQLEGANLSGARMDGTHLFKAQMEHVHLLGATVKDATFGETRLTGAQIFYTRLLGTKGMPTYLQGADLSGSVKIGGMIRHADLSGIVFDQRTDFRNAFLDGSVTMTPAFRSQMGNPCQWIDVEIADDAEFYGHWRGWVDAAPPEIWPTPWEFVAPERYKSVSAIPPPPGCTWKTNQMKIPGDE